MSQQERRGMIVPITSNRRQVSDSSGTDQPPQPPRPVRPQTPPPQDTNGGTDGNPSQKLTLQSVLPSAWAVTQNDAHVRPFSNSLRLVGRGETSHVLVVANKPIRFETLQSLALSRDTNTRSDALYVYYFEVSIESGLTWIGLVPPGQLQNKDVTPNRLPGDCPRSVGMASDGTLLVSGRQVQPTKHIEYHAGDRETIGCGLEITNTPRVFFTRNGQILLEPMEIPGMDVHRECYFPAVAVAPQGDVFASFGLARPYTFRWKGSSRHLFFSSSDIVQVPSSPRNYPTRVPPSPGNSPIKVPPSPGNPPTGRDWHVQEQDRLRTDGPPLMGNFNVGYQRAVSAALPSRTPISPLHHHRVTTIYGRLSNNSTSLEDDFLGPTSPELSSPAFCIDHSPKQGPFPPSNSSSVRSDTSDTKLPAQASSPYVIAVPRTGFPADSSFPSARAFLAGRGASQSTNSSEPTRPGAVWEEHSSTVMDKQEIQEAAACAHDLRRFCEDENTDESFQGLLQTCRSKQIQLRKTLEEGFMKFDDPKSEGTIHELLTVNESLLESIKMTERQLVVDTKPAPLSVPPDSKPFPPELHKPEPGITISIEIDVLVQTRDIFSLICMLRAQGDKRLESALALMRFARDAEKSPSMEAEKLRHEIRSSGGMDSLLALFRRKGGTRELKATAALAVAYLLPSFESRSLQSPSLGLKIVECLRLLLASEPVTLKGEGLSRAEMRAEMRTASAMGVYNFWIICVSPLLCENIAPARSFSEDPELMRGTSSRLRRRNNSLSHAGGNVFDQRQEVLELQELLQLTVSLIVEMAKTADLGDTVIRTLVPPICSIDLARPIAVREGVLKVLVSWMKSQSLEKIRCAATSINELTSTGDRYIAGWIHSQIVNEGALVEIVNISIFPSAGHVFRLAVAETLCRLCEAPHTRAAVVEAQCISCLICLLSEFEDPESQKVAFAAGSALLQLVVGAMSRASVFSSDNYELNEAASPDKRDRVISDAVEKGAIDQFVKIATTTSRGKLRALSVEALRVLSEDYHSSGRTRLQLCEVGAGGALGRVMKDDIEGSAAEVLARVMENDHYHDGRLLSEDDKVVKEVHQALCALANILDHEERTTGPSAMRRHSSAASTSFGGLSDEGTLVKGCIQFAKAGGLESLLTISALPFKRRLPLNRLSSEMFTEDADVSDLMVEICRSLASVSPLMLSTEAASQGYAAWSTLVLQALARILSSVTDSVDNDDLDLANELKFDALRGIGALAKYKPHKMVIVDRYLPSLFQARTARCDSFDVSGAADQVCVSLGFVEDEFAQHVAGNDPKLMGDWFCMKRSLLIQSMARAEIRKILFAVWKEPLRELLMRAHAGQVSGVGRWSSKESNELRGLHPKESVRSDGEIRELEDIFDVLLWDSEGLETRNTITEQYHHVYEHESLIAGIEPLQEGMRDWESSEPQSNSLMSSHVYPLNSTSTEKKWILSHRHFMLDNVGDNISIDVTSKMISEHVQTLMDCCVPSRLIQQDVMPIFDLRPESPFDFRGFLMPQRRYFSFRREGQLVSRLCDMNAVFLPSDDVHWTLVFTNSTFAGEFSESLVQFLYCCPLIKGLTFARNANWRSIWSSTSEDEGQDTSGLLANLAGSLPPWVSCVVYDNTLSDFALTALVKILETMTTLSASQPRTVQGESPGGNTEAVLGAQKQGSFRSFAVRNSPHLGREVWKQFFTLFRRVTHPSSLSRVPPLALLRVLDLSGNKLGDKLCSYVMGHALDKHSGCCLEQLDLSRNRIREGSRVVNVLHSYVKHYRFNQSAGVFVTKGSWKAPLISLNLSSNELDEDGGGLALELIASLKNDAFSLKSLDLSYNSLEGEVCQFTDLLLNSLVKNTCLRQLNLSGNRFSSRCIDGLLDRLNHSDSDSSLAFLQLDNNRPPLTEPQRKSLKTFANTSRTILLQRYLDNRDRQNTKDEDSVDSPFDTLSVREFPETDSFGPPSVSDTMSSVVAGTKRRQFLGKGENMITVLFSAPLVYHDEKRLTPFAKLDFDMERELLWQCLKEARRDIELFFDTAHSDRLLTAKTKRCSCLHYSGHGHPTHLPFENGKGMAHWLEVNKISDLIKHNEGPPFKFVFVSACHSGLVGETFASAGVPHVVCCQQESELKDSAALAFTRQFYLSLAVGHTVKEAFEQGRKAVLATPNLRNGEEEMKKFILLPKDSNHDVPVFDARPVREWPRTTSSASARSLQPSSFRGGRRHPGRGLVRTPRSIYFGGARSSELSVRNMMQEDPSPTPPQFFTGREVDMYHVLNLILTQKLVNVVGEKGVGRSSLVYGLCHYVNERSSTIPMIKCFYFLKPTQNRSSDRFVAMLRGGLKKLMQDGRVPQQLVNDMDLETLIHAICKALDKVKALLVIDHTDFLEGSAEAQDLVVFLRELFSETRTHLVRVLLIGRHPLGIPSIGGVVEQTYHLGPLTFCNTVHLFGNLCSHLHTPAERQKFCNRLVTDKSQSDLLPHDPATSERTQTLFDALGNGIPSRTETAAYNISSEELSRLEQI